jgi:hypothetical protein
VQAILNWHFGAGDRQHMICQVSTRGVEVLLLLPLGQHQEAGHVHSHIQASSKLLVQTKHRVHCTLDEFDCRA